PTAARPEIGVSKRHRAARTWAGCEQLSALSASAGQPEGGRGVRYEVTGEDEDSSRSWESDHVRDLLSVVISFPERLYGLRSAPAPQTRVAGAEAA
ncbi:MAG: hypothetical protein ACYCYK_14380, partial [Candidatus Dormibacteria bacterium]